MFAKLVIFLLSVLIGLQINSQQLSSADQSRLHVYLFEEFTKENNLKLNRVTRQGAAMITIAKNKNELIDGLKREKDFAVVAVHTGPASAVAKEVVNLALSLPQ